MDSKKNMNDKQILDINIKRIGDFIVDHLKKVPLLEGGIPPFSSVEFSNNAMCNRRCIFCPRVDKKLFPNRDQHLSFELFEKVIKDLQARQYTGRISFSGFCEPLLTKDLERYLATAKAICPALTIDISTNGDVLTLERLKSLMAAGLDCMRVSLYEGPEQESRFLKMKADLQLNDKQFIIRRRYSSENNYGLTISNRAGAITLKNEKVNLQPLAEALQQPCHYPFYKIMVDYTGEVMICSNDWLKKLIVGDLNLESVYDIWTGKKFTEVRKNLIGSNRKFAPCDVCDVNGLLNGQMHFDAWKNYYQSQGEVK